jgi:signal transduction histidine kinase
VLFRSVSDLLDLGRIEAGVGLKLEQFQVGEVVDRVVSSLTVQAAQKNIKFGTTLDPQARIGITADPALVHQAIYNLVDNAIKYTPVGGNVQVNVINRGISIQFAISDSGIGIAPLDQPRLFEKFYRGGQREAHQQRGSGLGLAIVKSIAERHHGKVWFESQLGRGSTFYLEIPSSQD